MSTISKEDFEDCLSRLLQESMVTMSKHTRLSKMAVLNGQRNVEDRWLRTSIRREGRKVEKSSPSDFLFRTRVNLIPCPSELSLKGSKLMSSMEKSRNVGFSFSLIL